ncbi:unnamed protein product [Adineta steineri]|uniref:NAD(P)(+)--arginine ADP-ribosyltransferase n=1 Tax=Adineta steineri TaxID=433720 RepID=A0A819TV54_9BILA|nr:unnamed protein product [Adineta steineri]CAF4087171.1 unnamed protein product [Adineta steineri]
MATSESLNERRQNLLPHEVSDNKEDIQLIWLDGNMDDSHDYLLTQSMLIELNPAVQFYSHFDRCLDFIKSVKHEQIFLIVSGAFAQQILLQTHHYRPLVAIFIFCSNDQHYKPLMEEYNKITGVFTKQHDLLESIKQKMNLIEKQTLTFSLFDQKQKSMKDLSQESASFLLHQMLIYVLKQMSQDKLSKEQMLDMCRDYYKQNKKELMKIEEFQNTYTRDKAIEWYTDECFLYKLLNKALRTEDIDLLFNFRFFIIDLCSAIEQENQLLKNNGALTLYRGTQIPNEELEKIKENIGKTISTNGFLSTSRNMNVSLGFIDENPPLNDFTSVLFEIKANPLLKTVVFADVGDRSRIKGEEEVLFNLNSLFKIVSVCFDSELTVWKVELNATDEGAEKVEEYLSLSKQAMEECSPLIYFGRLLSNELGQVDRAGKYFNMLLKSLPDDHPDIACVYNGIGAVHDVRDELNLALKNYEIAYEMRRKQSSSNHPHSSGSLSNIGRIYKAKGDFNTALDYYQQALTIEEKLYPGNNLQKAISIGNIGRVYTDKKDFDRALNYFFRALEMFKHVLPHQHSDIATCLGVIGDAHEKKGNLDIALDYYQQQLNMEEQCLPFEHSNLSFDLGSIIGIYKKMDEIDKALDLCQEKLLVQKTRLGENHPRIGRTLMIMADLIEDNNRKKALKYYEQALSVLENCTPPDYQVTSECLTSMAYLYSNCDMIENALRCELKALELYRQTLSPDHTNIANSLRNIGLCYERMNNLSEALRYFNESLSIYQANYGPEHEMVKRGEADIARLKEKQLSLLSHEEGEEKEEVEEKNSSNMNSSTVVKSRACVIQ